MKNNQKKILEILSRLEERLERLEETKPQAQKTNIEIIEEKIGKELKSKPAVVLDNYAKPKQVKFAREILARSYVVIVDGKSTIIMKRSEPESTKFVAVTSHKFRAGWTSREKVHDFLKGLLAQGETLTSKKVARLIHKNRKTANAIISELIKEGQHYEVRGRTYYLTNRIRSPKIRTAKRHSIMAEDDFDDKPKKRQLSRNTIEYNDFMAKRLKLYYQQGKSQKQAFKAGVADWRKAKSGQPGPYQADFPAFRGIKPEYLPILQGILKNLAVEGLSIAYRDIAYALDIQSESDFKQIVEQILAKWPQIRAYFGVSTNIKWDGRKLIVVV